MSARLAVFAAAALVLAAALSVGAAPAAKGPQNLFANPSFEIGRDAWQFDKAGGTTATWTIDNAEAAAGQASALVTIETVADWGVQFGQNMDAGAKGKTYTFAAVAKAIKDPVAVRLEIERPANPWDRAAASDKVTLKPGAWTEVHVTFKVEKDFREGWFAYISCAQAGAKFRVDAFRLYEGEYVPYDKSAKEEVAATGSGVMLFDTGATAAAPLSAEVLAAKAGWTVVQAGPAAPEFKGDAVLVNDRLAVVLRKGGPGAEVYSIGPKGATLRATLTPLAAADNRCMVVLDAVTVAANDPATVAVDADCRTAAGAKVRLRYELAVGQAFVKTDSLKSAAALRVDAPCRTMLLPDFFADDIVVDASEIPVAQADLPSESFLLHLLGDGDAILMTVSKDRDEDIRVSVDGQGAARTFRTSTIRYGKDGRIWVAVLEAPGIWHQRDITKQETGKVEPLDWKAPFPALWRMDWRKTDRLVDSWEVITQRAGGGYDKPGLFGGGDTVGDDRSRWTTVLGTFKYPCWIDRAGRGSSSP